MNTASDPEVIFISDNHTMARPARAPLRRILRAPFSRRTWAELAYTIVSALLAVWALFFIVPTLANGLLWGLSAPGIRKLNGASRFLARELLGEDVPARPRLRPVPYFKVRTPDAAQLAIIANKAGKVRKYRPPSHSPATTARPSPASGALIAK
jgi:hypothetical protein